VQGIFVKINSFRNLITAKHASKELVETDEEKEITVVGTGSGRHN